MGLFTVDKDEIEACAAKLRALDERGECSEQEGLAVLEEIDPTIRQLAWGPKLLPQMRKLVSVGSGSRAAAVLVSCPRYKSWIPFVGWDDRRRTPGCD